MSFRISLRFILAASLALTSAMAASSLVMVISYDQKAFVVFRQDGKTLTKAGTVPVGDGAREFCVSADGSRAYVSNEKANTITVVDLDKMEAVGTFAPPNIKRPDGCVTSPDSKKLYVAGLGSNDLFVIATDTNKVLKQLPIGEETRRVVRSPDDTKLYISSEGAKKITVLDPSTDQVVSSFASGGLGPRAMYFLPDHKTMLNLNVDDDTMSFIDLSTAKIKLTIGVGGAPQRIELSPDGRYAYVLASMEDKISVIDLKASHIRAGKFIPTPHQPVSMALSRDGALLFVTSRAENSVVGYDLATMKIVVTAPVSQAMGVMTR